MGMFPVGARIIPNPYNKIPGFSCDGPGGGSVHFVPGFPVMAWPMIEWVLEHHYAAHFNRAPQTEQSVVVFGAMEASLTPLMEQIENRTLTCGCSVCQRRSSTIWAAYRTGGQRASVFRAVAWQALKTGLQ